MKNKKQKNVIIITLVAVVLLLLVVAGVIVLANKIKNKNENKNKEGNTANVSEESRVKEVYYNNYLISYIIEGDVQTGEGKLRIDGDPNVYYAVTDYLLEDFHSIEDINKLIDDTLYYEAAIKAYKLMDSEYSNKYTEYDGTLYVKKKENPCNILDGETLDKDKIEYRKVDNSLYAVYNTVPVPVEYDQQKNLKAYTLWFTCFDNFTNIGTGKDDVFNPEDVAPSEDTNDDTQNENQDD